MEKAEEERQNLGKTLEMYLAERIRAEDDYSTLQERLKKADKAHKDALRDLEISNTELARTIEASQLERADIATECEKRIETLTAELARERQEGAERFEHYQSSFENEIDGIKKVRMQNSEPAAHALSWTCWGE